MLNAAIYKMGSLEIFAALIMKCRFGKHGRSLRHA